jgi:uncharacterized protein (DUF305 family)
MDDKSTVQPILFGVIGLLLGVVFAGYAANSNNDGMMRMMGMGRAHDMMNQGDTGMDMSMSMMEENLKDKSGDDFDRAFITQMITHHQGAINMAEDAKKSAKHEEIKKLADNIISAQTTEITQMKEWYKSWYNIDVPETDNGMMH